MIILLIFLSFIDSTAFSSTPKLDLFLQHTLPPLLSRLGDIVSADDDDDDDYGDDFHYYCYCCCV